MSRLVRLFLLLPLVVSASGCLSSATLIRLKPDGSGTIEQTLLANLQALKGLAQLFGKGDLSVRDAPSADQMFNEAELRAAAEKLGRGVRFVSRTSIKEGSMEGVKAVYAFDDVNALAVNQNPSMPGVGGNAREDMTFRLAKLASGNSLVTVTLPEGKDAIDAEDVDRSEQATKRDVPPEMMAAMQQMFEGMKVVIDVEVDGRIVNTNSSYVSGPRVTLLELDLGALIQQREALERVQKKMRPGMTVNELKDLMQGIRGVKVNDSPLTIEFRGR